MHREDIMQNKLFVGFISLILAAHIHKVMLDKELYKRMTMKKLLISLSKLRLQIINGTRILFILPPIRTSEEANDVLEIVDGLLLTGGGDISPIYLRKDPLRGIGKCFPERDESEILLTQLALQQGLPLLGICRGIQVLAVAAGGEIYQDIPSQCSGAMEHKQTAPRQYAWHDVDIVEESVLYRLLQETKIGVNSLHHQAVSEIPQGFIQNARASDGIIEGIEMPGAKFCVGVQWHPESMGTEAHSKALFRGFIAACQI